MGKRILFVIMAGLALLSLAGCSGGEGKEVIPDTPYNTANIARTSLINGNYSQFNSLFSEGRKNSISEMEFNKIKKDISSGGAGLTSYQLVRFQDGKALLIRLTQEKDSKGYYGIEDVKIVPEESMNLFAP